MNSKGLYVYTNNKNGMQYVGKANVLSNRVLTHAKKKGSKALAEAIDDIGLENFSIQLIPFPDATDENLAHFERQKILELGALSPNGYNQRLPRLPTPIPKTQRRVTRRIIRYSAKAQKNRHRILGTTHNLRQLWRRSKKRRCL